MNLPEPHASSAEEHLSAHIADQALVTYTGYVVRHANDFEFEEPAEEDELIDFGASAENGEAALRKGNFNGKRISIILAVLLLVMFVVSISFLVFGQECKLSLCQKLDKSSPPESKYKNPSLEFVAPLKYAWAAFAVSILGAAILSLYAFFILKIEGLTSNMANVTILMQRATRSFIFNEYKLLLVLLMVLFAVPAISKLWAMAACFLIGAVMSAILGLGCAAISVRGSVTTAAVAKESVRDCLTVALRTGSLVGIATVSLAVGGVAVCYLIFQDVRALAGFALGVSSSALLTRVAGGLFMKAANVSSDSLHDTELWSNDRSNPARLAKSVGEVLANVSGMASDFMSSYVVAIVATAILGASLPYFYQNSYAMCVFNHLDLDRTCVAYDRSGQKASFAAGICRLDDFHLRYLNLSTLQSNSLFVALPFILGFVSILNAAFCSIRFFAPNMKEVPETRRDKTSLLRSALWRLRFNVIVSTALTIICAAAICWSLFGGNSAFQKAHASPLDRFVLQPLTETNAVSRCRPVAAQEGTGKTGLPELEPVRGPYRPINAFGTRYSAVSQVPWRLFLCIALGCLLGVTLAATADAFNWFASAPSKEKALTLDDGRGFLTTETLGKAMIFTFVPVTIIISCVSVSSKLFGSYGVGLSALGLVSSVGSVASFDSLRAISSSARVASQEQVIPLRAWKTTEVVDVLAKAAGAIARAVSGGAAALSSFALLAVLLQESGLVPGSRQLVGTLAGQPSKHVTDAEDIDILNIFVLGSVLAGIVLPYVFAAFVLLSGNHGSLVMMSELMEFIGSSPRSRRDLPDMGSEHQKCVTICSTAGLINVILPVLLVVGTPLALGFGFGTKGLVGFMVGVISASLLLSSFLNSTAGSLTALKAQVEGEYGTRPENSGEWKKAIRTGEAWGDSLTDCCAPCLVSMMKVTTAVSVVAAPLMQTGVEKGWIGVIVLCGTLLIGAVMGYIVRKWRRSKALRCVLKGDGDGKEVRFEPKINGRCISPFYEEGPRLDEKEIAAWSAFADFKGKYVALGYSEATERWYPYTEGGDVQQGGAKEDFDEEDRTPKYNFLQVNL